MVVIPFQIAQPDGTYEYSDALVLPDDHGLSPAELDGMKQARYDNWYTSLDPLPVMED